MWLIESHICLVNFLTYVGLVLTPINITAAYYLLTYYMLNKALFEQKPSSVRKLYLTVFYKCGHTKQHLCRRFEKSHFELYEANQKVGTIKELNYLHTSSFSRYLNCS